jgi:hypothetical protein
MTVGEGKFLLYSYITPALKADDYRFDVSQAMTAKKGTNSLGATDLPIDSLQTHVRVTAPRYQLPPDQVLSTFPPAGSEGAYGSRLPQVVIKRRTLPWERGLTVPDGHGGETAVDERTPWLALVLIAEGEAEIRLNQNVDKCVTAGVVLDGEKDVAKGNCLVIRQSVLEKVLPSRKDVPLLAHAREVDIHDTELMMGDDDGFLAVVISNRLPVAGVDADGNEVPVKYLACLINLEGQFQQLIPQAPPPIEVREVFDRAPARYVQPGVYDHVAGGGLVEHWGQQAVNPAAVLGQVGQISQAISFAAGPLGDPPAEPLGAPEAQVMGHALSSIASIGPEVSARTSTAGYAVSANPDVYTLMANDFLQSNFLFIEPEYTFPVLLHWSFVSTGETTFESLMRGLDSGLHGSVPEHAKAPEGRPPLEVVETGHVGLDHRTRRGDSVRTWYRGPLLAHPSSGERLPIAHASDQLRAVIGDGREDISLAAAFEVGRLLALSRPAMVAALMRWRQQQYQTARAGSIWEAVIDFLPFADMAVEHNMRTVLDGKLRELVAGDPDALIGRYRSPVTAGDPVDWGDTPLRTLGRGLGVEGDLSKTLRDVSNFADVTAQLRTMSPPIVGSLARDGVLQPAIVDQLHGALDTRTEQLMSNVLADRIKMDPVFGPGMIRRPPARNVVPRSRGRGASKDEDAIGDELEPDPLDVLLARRRPQSANPSPAETEEP